MKAKRSLRIGVMVAFLFLFWVVPGQAQNRKFGGVGLQVVPTIDGDLVVLNVVRDSPALAAGIEPGDMIVQVDDFPLKGSDFTKVVKRYLWGPVGSKLTLKFLRPGVAGPHAVTLVRKALETKPVHTPGVRLLKPQK